MDVKKEKVEKKRGEGRGKHKKEGIKNREKKNKEEKREIREEKRKKREIEIVDVFGG